MAVSHPFPSGVCRDPVPDVPIESRGQLSRLHAAIGTGEIVTIVYMKGSQPGTKRDVVPRAVTQEDLRAFCLAANELRNFKMEHVRLVEPNADAPAYVAGAGTVAPTQAVLPDGPHGVLARNATEIEALGWYAMVSDEALTLYERAADGAPIAKVSVGIGRWDKGDGRTSWIVQAQSGKRRSRKRLDSAERLFLAAAREPSATRSRTQSAKAVVSSGADRFEGWSASKIAIWLALAFVVGIGLGLAL